MNQCEGRPVSTQRLLWIDVLKILSAFFIVLHHSIASEWIRALDNAKTPTWYLLNFLFEISEIGLPIFFLCSGAVMLNKERSLRRIYQHSLVSVIKVYFFWMLIYGAKECLSLIANNHASARTLVNAMIKNVLFGQYHTWFIPTLLGLYIITPILYLIVQNRDMGRYFILLSVLFTILIPLVEEMDSSGRLANAFADVNMHFCVGYSLYFVLGYYIATTKQTSKTDLLVFLVSTCAAFLISNHRAFLGAGGDTQSVYTEFSLLGFLMCTSLFFFFKRTGDRWSAMSDTARRLVAALSRYGIAVYLMHPLFLPLIQNLDGMLRILGAVLVWVVVVVVVARIIDFFPIRSCFLGNT